MEHIQNCPQLCALLTDAGLYQWRSSSVLDNSPILDRLIFHFGIENLVSMNPAVAELPGLLHLTPNGVTMTKNLKGILNPWARKHGLPVRFVIPSELPDLAKNYIQKKVLHPRTMILNEATGFIDMVFWNLMVGDEEMIFPLADPHDVAGHVPALTIPRLFSLLGRKARFVVAAEKLANESSQLYPAIYTLLDHLNSEIRLSTWENLTFLHRLENGQFQFVTQGNRAFKILASKVFPVSRFHLAEAIVSRQAKDSRKDLRRLPAFGKYIQEKRPAWTQFLESENKLGKASWQSEEDLMNAIRAIDQELAPEVAGVQDPIERTISYFTRFAPRAAANPDLSASLNLENRLDYLEHALNFYEDYLEWIKNRPKRFFWDFL